MHELGSIVRRALLEPSRVVTASTDRQRMRVLAAICLPLIAFEVWSIALATPEALPIYVVAALFWVVAYAFSRTSHTTVAGLYAALAACVIPYAGIGTELASTSSIEEVMWLVLAVLVASLTLPTTALAAWGVANVAVLATLFSINTGIPHQAALNVVGFMGLVTFLAGIWSSMRTRDDRLIEQNTNMLTEVAESLRQEKDFTNKTIAAMEDVLLVVDSRRNIMVVNRALCALLGFDENKLAGLPAALLFANPDTVNEVFSGMLRKTVSTGDQIDDIAIRLLSSQGMPIPMTLNASAIRDDRGRLLGAVCVARDMRPAVKLADMAAKEALQLDRYNELESTNRRLVEAQAQLIHAGKLAAVGQLAAAVDHEINNPLTTIQLSALFLRDELSKDTDSQAHVSNIVQEGKRAQDIVQKLLEFGRETGLVQEPVDLLDIVRSSLALVGHKIRMRGVGIDTSTMEGRFIVIGDPAQLRQVVINLLLNAGQSVQAGGKITLGMEVLDGMVHLSVKDTGHGMTKAVRERIFEPFFTTREFGEGTGLGLSVSYGIIRGHGGSIEVESRESRGSTFTLVLPWRPERTKPVVLIVDDDPVILPALSTAVRRAGCECFSAQNSHDALGIVAGHDVDIVISDMNLGRDDGVELLTEIYERYPAIITMLISGATIPDVPDHIFDFLPKPISMRDLKHAIGKAMEARRSARSQVQVPVQSGIRRPDQAH